MHIAKAVYHFVIRALVKIGLSQAGAALVTRVVFTLAINAAIQAAVRSWTPKPRQGAIDQGAELRTKVDSAYPREVAVGTFATGGSLGLEDVSGATNQYYWRVVPFSDCEIEEITAIRGNGQVLTFSGDIHTGLRACTSHFQAANGNDMLFVRIYKGTSAQTADADLLAALAYLDSNFRGRGIAYAIFRMEWDPDAWAGGAEFVITGKGAKVGDPRTGVTAWSENLMLIARAFLRGFSNNGIRVVGLGAVDADIPEAYMASGADICDDDVTLAAGGTEKRYRGGGMISARETPREVLTNLCAGMAARHIDNGGQIILLPGAAQTPVLHFGENDLVADDGVSYAARVTADERVNAIVSTFVNPDEGYQEGPLPPRKNAAAITADGDRHEANRAYRYVLSKTQGQRLDEIELRAARCEARFACSAPLWAFELAPGDWVTAENRRWRGSKTFVVITNELMIVGGSEPQARCALQLREIASSVYDWTTADEITVASAAISHPAGLASNFDAQGRLAGAAYVGNPTLTGATAYRTPINPLSSSDAGSTATVSIASHTVKTSDANGTNRSAAYNSGSVTGLSFTTAYHIFAYDPTFAGGTVTYVAATSSETYISDSRYIYVGYITTIADGGGGGSSPPPPPENCVAAAAWVDDAVIAGAIAAGDELDVLTEDGRGVERAIVEGSHLATVNGVRLVTSSGVSLRCSSTTPITQPSGAVLRAIDAAGAKAAVIDAAGFRWETIVAREKVGLLRVARIHIGGRTYAAGDDPERRMFTHNPLKP